MHSLLQDARFSFRLMRKNPGKSFVILAALVLGIGVNSAMFSVVNAVVLRPVPLRKPDRLVWIFVKTQESDYVNVSWADFQDWRQQARSFEGLGATLSLRLNLSGSGPPERLAAVATTASYFKTLGVSPLLGRDFMAEDEQPGSPRVAVLSYGIWQRRFAGDPGVLGHTVKLNDQVYSIIGVLPPNPYDWLQVWDVWVGIGPFLDEQTRKRDTRFLVVLGRLAAGTNPAQGATEMETIGNRLARQYPDTNKNMGVNVQRLEGLIASFAKPLWPVVGASLLMLLLACVNVITVFMASAALRRRELGVRLALGAGRSAIWRQLVVEGLIYAVLGAGLGLMVAKVALSYLMKNFPNATVRFQETTMDQRVFWFTICLAVGSTLLASVLPGVHTGRLAISSALKGDWKWMAISRSGIRGAGALIAGEVSLAVGLALVSVLLVKSFYELEKVDLGFNADGVMCFQITLPDAGYKEDAAKARFLERAVSNLRAIPGVESVSASHTLPAVTNTEFINLQVDSQSPMAGERPFVDRNSVLPEFFATMSIPIIEGREFTDADRAGGREVAIVDSALAARMWPGQSAIGKRLRLADLTDSSAPWREVVGVVRQVNYFGPEGRIERPQAYEPAYERPASRICFVIKTKASVAMLRAAVQKAISDVVADLPVDRFQPLSYFVGRMENGRKVSVLLLSGFAGVGIVLGLIGIYGVVANSVIERRRELAIRMAVGASARSAIWLVMKGGLLATLVGIGVGGVLVVCSRKIFSAFLFGVTALDPGIFVFSGVAIAVLALIATLIPATGVLRMHPQDILKE